MYRFLLVILFTSIFFVCLSHHNVFTKPLNSSVRIGRLNNGFTYYLKKSKEKMISAQFVVKAGYNQETSDQLQLSHLIEHLAFRETKNFQNPLQYFQEKGLEKGKDINAQTASDRTVYYSKIPSGNAELLRDMLKFYHDCAHNISLTESNIDKESLVVLEELQGGKDFVEEVVIRKKLIGDTKFSKIDLEQEIGNLKTFEHFSLRDYYNTWYRANYQAVIIVGDFDLNEVERNIRRLFSDLKASPAVQVSDDLDTSFFSWKNQIVTVANKEVKRERIVICLTSSHRKVVTTDNIAKNIHIRLFQILMSCRLKEMSSKFKYISDVTTSYETISERGPKIDVLKLSFSYQSDNLRPGFQEILTELERVKRYGFSENELLEARKKIKLDEQLFSTNDFQVVNSLIENFVSETSIYYSPSESELLMKIIDEVSVTDLKSTVAELLSINNNLSIFRITPNMNSSDMLGVPQILSMSDSVKLIDLNPYECKSTSEEISYGNIKSGVFETLAISETYTERRDKATGMKSLVLKNGIEVYFKQLKDENGPVSVQSINFRNVDSMADQSFLGKYSHYIVNNSGLGTYTSKQLKKYLADHSIENVNSYISGSRFGFAAQFDQNSFEELLKVLYLYSTEPKVDTSVFNYIIRVAKDENSESLSRQVDLMADTINYFRRKSSKNVSVEFENVTSEQILSFFKERFSTTYGSKFIVSGNFDYKIFKNLVLKYLGNIPSKSSPDQTLKTAAIFLPTTASIQLNSGKGEKSSVQLFFDTTLQASMINRITIEFVTQYLDLNLFERLRRQETGTYGITVNYSHLDIDSLSHNSISISFSCQPENVTNLINSVKNEVDRLKQNVIEDSSFKSLQKSFIEKFKNDFQSSIFWTEYFVAQMQKSHPLDDINSDLKFLKKMKPSHINKAARILLDESKMSTFITMPKSFQ